MERDLNKMIRQFIIRPVDSDYQQGYLDALVEVRRMLRDSKPAKKGDFQ